MGYSAEKNELIVGTANATYYFRLRERVRLQNIAATPQPLVFGDTENESATAVMVQTITTRYGGGSGLYLGNSRTDTERFYFSRLDTTRDWLALPEEIATSALTGDAAFQAGPITWLGYRWLAGTYYQYAAANNKIYSLTGGGPAATLEFTAAGGQVTDAAEYKGVMFVALGGLGSGYCYQSAVGAWTGILAATLDPEYLCVLDGKLWATAHTTDVAHQGLWVSTDGTTWTAKAAITTAVLIRKLFTWKDSEGTSRLYAATNQGLWSYDDTNDKWLQVLGWPPDSLGFSGYGACVWTKDERLYVCPGGLTVLAITMGKPIQVESVGPDRDHGVPADEAGAVVSLVGDHNFLYALTYPVAPGTNTTIRRWNGRGWHLIWSQPAYPPLIIRLGISTAQGASALEYRLWFIGGRSYSQDGKAYIRTMKLPTNVFNPRVYQPGTRYQRGINLVNPPTDPLPHISPWWYMGNQIRQKIMGHIFVETENCSASNWVKLYVGTDFDEAWTLVTTINGLLVPAGTITSDGVQDLRISEYGIQKRYFRTRLDLFSSDPLVTPRVRMLNLETMPILPVTLGYSFDVDLTKPYPKQSPDQMRQSLLNLMNPAVTEGFYTVSYWDQSDGSPRSRYGRLTRSAGQEWGGDLLNQGSWLMALVTPYEQDAV